MFKIFCTTSKKCLRLISALGVCALVLFSCQHLSVSHKNEPTRLTEREVVFQKGLALFENEKFTESAGFFLKVTQTNLGADDEVYND